MATFLAGTNSRESLGNLKVHFAFFKLSPSQLR